MDAGTADAVDAIMGDVFRGSTVVTVAHRLSSVVKNCDRVAVMSDGVIVELGNPRWEESAWSGRRGVGASERRVVEWYLVYSIY